MFFLGIDFGTSGARAIAINADRQIAAQATVRLENTPPGLATRWQEALWNLLGQLPVALRQQVQAIAINGTSATVLVCDGEGKPLDEPILYNDDRGAMVLDQVRAIAPPHHTVVSATSSLAKLLWWSTLPSFPCGGNTPEPHRSPVAYFLHQADWLSFLLHGRLGMTDYHNALKLGYDVGQLCYPDWMNDLPPGFVLPQVMVPGEAIAPITPEIATRFDLPGDCLVCAGTTDSIAAFLASGADAEGEAVTSLGSTLVLKLLSKTRVDDARYGIYSHRLGDLWLVGGASNTGGAVLKQFFDTETLQTLSAQIDPDRPTSLNYYPLLKPGERFPINDPHLPPQLEPRPVKDIDFLHGLLEGIARIEAQGYALLQSFGATPVTRVYTAGGGAQNSVWARMRSRLLGVPVMRSPQTEAAYGTALLAMKGYSTR